ncbi:MAG: hypothetical protein LQ347_004347 [Umbilicaria vellea]|nr:MAG: hypothetical protein LQ347_004347 [Umbilicaria vellea]
MVQVKVILALVAVLAPIVGAAPMPAAGDKRAAAAETDVEMLYRHDKAKREVDLEMLYDHDKAKRGEDLEMLYAHDKRSPTIDVEMLYRHDKAKREVDLEMLYDHDKRSPLNADFDDESK